MVAEQIDALVDEGVAQPKDIAVFYRATTPSRVFEEAFVRHGMPYKVVGGMVLRAQGDPATRWPT